MPDEPPKTPPPVTAILQPPGELDSRKIGPVQNDLKLIRRALRENWPIPAETKKILIERMTAIVKAGSVPIPNVDGKMIDRVDVANQQAIQATRNILEADKTNQTDFWNEDKKDQTDYWLQQKTERLDQGLPTENVAYTLGTVHQLPLPESLKDDRK